MNSQQIYTLIVLFIFFGWIIIYSVQCLIVSIIEAVRKPKMELIKALAKMRFAYLNKDNPPHKFETEALESANKLLEPYDMEELLKEGK